MSKPQHIDLDTPEGRLSLTWPQPQGIYTLDSGSDPEPVAYDIPMDPGPFATLNGKEITVERAKEIVRAMAENAQRN